MTVRATDLFLVLQRLPGGLAPAEDRAAARLLRAAQDAARSLAAEYAAARDYVEHGIMDEAWTHTFAPGCER